MRARMTWMTMAGLVMALALAVVAASEPVDIGPVCGMMDGLETDLVCCNQSFGVTLPEFPELSVETRYFTWRRCNLTRNKPICLDIGPPAPLPLPGPGGLTAECAYTIPFDVRTCGAQEISLFVGDLIGNYGRTWVEETDPESPGPDVQVWRFLLNGDLEPTPFLLSRFGDNPNIPLCYLATNNRIHWFGYIDYRYDCNQGTFTAEWALNHECDQFHHHPSSLRPAPPGGYHPDRSFSMAGPVIALRFDVVFEPIDGSFGFSEITFQYAFPSRNIDTTLAFVDQEFFFFYSVLGAVPGGRFTSLVPEPGSASLVGLSGLLALSRRRRR